MTKTVAILCTLDTKGPEAGWMREQVEALGGTAWLVDIGVVGAPGTAPDVTREEVAQAGGTPLAQLLADPTRQKASPVMVAGATQILLRAVQSGRVHALVGLGGTQGTPNCTQVMQALPYGFPKVMVSTLASGDVSPFVGIKDVTMMFSVSDILGLNPLTRKILANAAAAAFGMATSSITLESASNGKPLIGMTNLGVLTEGAMHAVERFHERGYEVIVFHAVGSGGRAMEQLMREGLIGAVFDYAMGELADEMYHGLRAGDATRLTVAGDLGLPQVLCPGGLEHIGLLVPANQVPEAWREHRYVFHNPVILAPRLSAPQLEALAAEIGRRLRHTNGKACLMLPLAGTSRYGIEGGALRDPEGDAAFFEALRKAVPPTVELVERDLGAEDPRFVDEAVARLVSMIED
ncbi:MAG TPA: Tm-1-like ATP-binding domain-containing protein [Planctomycetota bacterium]|nr:Tm-1-like ATP-binding domain-containing protein [Planctomycetota bacterium]